MSDFAEVNERMIGEDFVDFASGAEQTRSHKMLSIR
jgi:hypothetical protein